MVGERLAELREQKALTLHDLEEASGVGADAISKIENGHRKPRPSTLRKLAAALGVEVEDFFKEPVLAGKAEAPDTGPPGTEQTARDIAHADALQQDALNRKAMRRTVASEGIDPARRISDIYSPTVYDALRRRPPEELAGDLLDAERDYVHETGERALLEEAFLRVRQENARLRQEIAELRSEAEREREAAR